MTDTRKRLLTAARVLALPLVGLAMMSASAARAESPLGEILLDPGANAGTSAPQRVLAVDITLADHIVRHNVFRSDPLINTYGRAAQERQLGAVPAPRAK